MTDTILAMVLGVLATALVATGGYVFGVRLGRLDRDTLRRRLAAQDAGLRNQLRTVTQSMEQHETAQRLLEQDLRTYLDRLGRAPDETDSLRSDLTTLLAPVLERERDDRELRSAIQHLLTPLVEREQLGYQLAHLPAGSGERGELPRLLDDIAAAGGYVTVLLSDGDGLPLAASHNTGDMERLSGTCSLVMLVADRLTRDNASAPSAVTIHDEANGHILCRFFTVADQTLLLTAVAPVATNLGPTALDPALVSVLRLLTPAPAGS